jgi:hypothetical protein
MNKEEIKAEIELMEKEILYLKGRKRLRARRKYLLLRRSCRKNCLLDEPIYIDRILKTIQACLEKWDIKLMGSMFEVCLSQIIQRRHRLHQLAQIQI